MQQPLGEARSSPRFKPVSATPGVQHFNPQSVPAAERNGTKQKRKLTEISGPTVPAMLFGAGTPGKNPKQKPTSSDAKFDMSSITQSGLSQFSPVPAAANISPSCAASIAPFSSTAEPVKFVPGLLGKGGTPKSPPLQLPSQGPASKLGTEPMAAIKKTLCAGSFPGGAAGRGSICYTKQASTDLKRPPAPFPAAKHVEEKPRDLTGPQDLSDFGGSFEFDTEALTTCFNLDKVMTAAEDRVKSISDWLLEKHKPHLIEKYTAAVDTYIEDLLAAYGALCRDTHQRKMQEIQDLVELNDTERERLREVERQSNAVFKVTKS